MSDSLICMMRWLTLTLPYKQPCVWGWIPCVCKQSVFLNLCTAPSPEAQPQFKGKYLFFLCIEVTPQPKPCMKKQRVNDSIKSSIPATPLTLKDSCGGGYTQPGPFLPSVLLYKERQKEKGLEGKFGSVGGSPRSEAQKTWPQRSDWMVWG